jgi:hypothetical protein
MSDRISVVNHGKDAQTVITLDVSYAGSKKATILVKPGQSLASLERDLRTELRLLAEALTTAPISG